VQGSIAMQRAARTGLAVGYPEGPLTDDRLGGAGALAGARAPDLPLAGAVGRLHLLLRHGGWTLLVFPPVDGALPPVPAPCGLITWTVADEPTRDPARLCDRGDRIRTAYTGGRPGLVLVRPDGYLGFRGGPADTDPLQSYLRRVVR
jgi:hypothetical protein